VLNEKEFPIDGEIAIVIQQIESKSIAEKQSK